MSKAMLRRKCLTLVCGASVLAATSGRAAQVFNLRAEAFTNTYALIGSAPKSVLMWGFATNGGLPSCPGPVLTVPPGETGLVIHLVNNLSVPVSIMIPGQDGFVRDAPHATFTDAQGRTRARSIVKETPGGGSGTYEWNGLRPGTYLYHSGSHPALQVEMGLYGMLKHDAAAGAAYSNAPYAAETNWFFSAIDLNVHGAVAAGKYETRIKSMIHSTPEVYLLNGQPYRVGELPLAAGQTTLVRLLNATYDTRCPVLVGHRARVVAEDGRPYPYPKEENAIDLPALKTRDALLLSASAVGVRFFDRRILTAERPPRVLPGLVALYDFREGAGRIVHDVSGVGAPMDLRFAGAETNIHWFGPGTNGVRFASAGASIRSQGAATKIIDALRASGALTLEAWARPRNLTQGGPARIVSINSGAGIDEVNASLSQDAADSRFRLRRGGATSVELVNNSVFVSSRGAPELQHVVVTYDGATVRTYVDGRQRQATLAAAGSFLTWDATFALFLGNVSGAGVNGAWLGTLRLVAAYDRALAPLEVQRNFEAGPYWP